MKKSGFLFALLLVCVGAKYGSMRAQTVVAAHFNCIVYNVTTCPAALEHYSGTATLEVVAGYAMPGDGGGGEYVTGVACPDVTSGASGNFAIADNTIRSVAGITASIVVGSIINAPGNVPVGTEIAALPSSGDIVMTEPAIASGTGASFTITGPNGGTVIRATTGGSPLCFYKTNYRGDPHEFGAVGDGSTPDTTAIQSWLGAYGMVTNPSAHHAPPNFGPWIATLPANYQVSAPLVCPQYANLQAPANITSGDPGAGGSGSPPVTISAAALVGNSGTFQGTVGGQPALMMASPYCRISGIALDATNIGDYYFNSPGTTSTSTPTTVTYTGTPPTGLTVGMPISDLQGDIPSGATITALGSGSVTISQNVTGSSTSGETITITGFYTLDVAGTHVGVDSHSLLQGGYDNVYCADSQLDGLQVKDAQVQKAWHDGAHITNACDNMRLVADVFQSNGKDGTGAGVWFSGIDLTLADGIAEQSGGQGLFITGSDQADITGMVFAGNNAGATTGQAPNVQIDSSANISFCGNRIQGSAGDTASTSAVLFSGVDDNITLCGNAYTARNAGNDANVLPLFTYDVSTPPPTITNTHIYEMAARAAVSVFTPAAQSLLQPLQVPPYSQSQFSGLTLSNGGTSLQINVAPGAAVDSTNSTIITLPSTCTVDLTKSGAGGLDTGSAMSSTTYFIFIIAPATANPGSLAPAPSCMASKSLTPPTLTIPAFTASGFAGTGYQVATTLAGTLLGGSTIYNVNPLAGVSVGDAIMSTDSSLAPTTITGFTANSGPGATETGILTPGSNVVTTLSITSGVQVGMAIQDMTHGCIPTKAYIVNIMPTIQMSKPVENTGVCATYAPYTANLSISGALQLTVNSGAAATEAPAPLVISTGYYRMVGAVFTTSAITPTLVTFTQDNDTFYLMTPAADVSNITLSSGANTLGPLSAPNNIVTEAFGRCIATGGTLTNYVELYTPSTTPGSGANFPSVPGYALTSVASSASVNGVSFPYRLHTNISRNLDASATSGSPVLNCMTDGWVWKRAQ